MRVIALSIFWWTVTVLTLFVMDDMVFGPVFWAISVWSQVGATVLAFVISLLFQLWLVRAGTSSNPGRVAKFMLKRLMLERKNPEVEKREEKIKAKSAKISGAILVSPLIGGVLPILLLYKHQFSRNTTLEVAWATTFIYAIEFCLLHGGYGFGRIAHSIFG